MYKIAKPLFLVCETPLHAGSGDSLGVVDLPIQRERHTSFPKIEGSSLKGALRQAFNGLYSECTADPHQYREAITLSFGPEETGAEGHAGALGFTDARLLLFPVKSMKGVFGWITCPKVLHQLYRDMSLTEFKDHEAIMDALAVKPLSSPLKCTADNTEGCSLFLQAGSNKIVLEEYTFGISNQENTELSQLLTFLAEQLFPLPENGQPDIYEYWRKKLKTDVVVLPNEDFTDFVNLSTEVITRTKINSKTGTVEKGALFTEEYLPAESIMYSLVLASPIFKETNEEKGIFNPSNDIPGFEGCEGEEGRVIKFFETVLPEVIQIGGNATLGKGLVRTRFFPVHCGDQNGGTEHAPE